MFSKMSIINNNYYITSKKTFIPLGTFKNNTIEKVFEFAYNMTFSGEGKHRDHRSGGTYKRRNGEIFANTFQGKLAECALYNLLIKNKINTTEPDFSIYKLGIWDDEDINVNGKSISIKSTKSFGNLLLLEEKDWNTNAVYLPNEKSYDYIFLIRMNPFCEEILKKNRILYSDYIDKYNLKNIIKNNIWEYDIPGFISKDDLINIINSNHIIYRNDILNGTTTMDATNYYVQAGDMKDINKFILEIIK